MLHSDTAEQRAQEANRRRELAYFASLGTIAKKLIWLSSPVI